MTKKMTVLLVEDDPVECKALIKCIDSTEDLQLVETTGDARKALEYTREYLPDSIILDLELHKGGGNGVSFLAELRKAQLPVIPFVLVTTNNISRITQEQVRQMGADFIMVKSQTDYSAENVIDFLRILKESIQKSRYKAKEPEHVDLSPSEMRKRLATRVTAAIDEIGISPAVIGRGYLIEAITLYIQGQKDFVSVIASKYKKSNVSVQRAMQSAIERNWKTNDPETLYERYTARVRSDRGMPTLNEFIYYYADKLKNEY